MIKGYPPHIYELVRVEVATTYIKHEFRKLFGGVTENYWDKIDKDISGWISSSELANPRDFWNGFHGICMGFKLKIGLVYAITAENISWTRKQFPVNNLWFGTELQQTKLAGEGKLSAEKIAKFYFDPANEALRKEQLEFTLGLSKDAVPRDDHPIIAVQNRREGEIIYPTFDGNRRLIKAILEGKDTIDAFVGEFTSGDKYLNYWISTTLLMENLYFAKDAYDGGDRELFEKYMDVLKHMLSCSQSAVYELRERALTGKQSFKDDVLKALKLD